jgi:hypothetical protein
LSVLQVTKRKIKYVISFEEEEIESEHETDNAGWQLYLGVVIGLIAGVVGSFWTQIIYDYSLPNSIIPSYIVLIWSVAFFAVLGVLIWITVYLYTHRNKAH